VSGLRDSREGKVTGTLCSGDISTKFARIAELAQEDMQRVFSSLHHVIDVAWLREGCCGRSWASGSLDGARRPYGQRTPL